MRAAAVAAVAVLEGAEPHDEGVYDTHTLPAGDFPEVGLR
jgi:hypothetical protein